MLIAGVAIAGFAVGASSSPDSPFPPPPLPVPFAPPPPSADAPVLCSPAKYDANVLTGKVSVYRRGAKLKPMNETLNNEDLLKSGYTTTTFSSDTLENVDWREKDSPIKNQGDCGSCWAHAFTEVMEWHLYNQTGMLAELSQMEVTACTQYAYKCEGGVPWEVVLDYGLSRRPLIPGSVYPYDPRLYGFSESFDSECIQCDVNASSVAEMSTTGYINPSARLGKWGVATKMCFYGACDSQNTTELALALKERGPLMVSVDANSAWDEYKGGILPAASCNSSAESGDHAVVLVGATDEAWIVRNSWGVQWGEEGYIRLERKDGMNTCGVANHALWMTADPITWIG